MKTKRNVVFCNKEVFKEVAEELGLTASEVEKVFNSQPKFTKKIMESNTFDGIRWPYLGVFKAKPKLVQFLSHLQGLNKEQAKLFKKQIREGYDQSKEKS